MGCGAGKPQQRVDELEKEVQSLEKQVHSLKKTEKENADAARKVQELEKELGRLKAEKEKQPQKGGKGDEAAAAADNDKPPEPAGGEELTVQFVVRRDVLPALQALGNVKVALVNACEEYPEVPVNVAGTPEALLEALKAGKRETWEVSVAPAPKTEALANKEQPLQAEQEEEDGEAEKPAEEPTKVQLEKAEFKCSSSVDVSSAWEGKVVVEFQWVDDPTPFSEYLNPSGSNWGCKDGGVRVAPDLRPRDVKLEWRQGASDDWHTIEATGGKCQLEIHPDEVSTMNFNGFQSRWLVDGEYYLSPLQRAPTLIGKLMNYPVVRNAFRQLPEDKREIANLPEAVRKPIETLENIIPMNTWDVGYGAVQVPGGYLNGEHVMTAMEKASNIAKEKLQDPKIQATLRAEALKAPINVVSVALGTVGIKLAFLVKNMDFFIPAMAEPDFAAYDALMDDAVLLEQMRRDMQIDVNGMYPDYQAGLRVAFPSAKDLRNAITTKRPSAVPGTRIKVKFQHEFSNKEQFESEHTISVTYWLLDSPTERQTLQLVGEEVEEKVGMLSKETKKLWKVYKGVADMLPGVYGYCWNVDGKNYYDEGRPMPDGEGNYAKLTVVCGVRFGVGVKMP